MRESVFLIAPRFRAPSCCQLRSRGGFLLINLFVKRETDSARSWGGLAWDSVAWRIPWACGGCSQHCGSSWHQGELRGSYCRSKGGASARGIFPQTLTRTPTSLFLWSMMPVWTFALNPPWGSPKSREKNYRDKRLRKEKVCSQSHSGVSNNIHSFICSFVHSFKSSCLYAMTRTSNPMLNKVAWVGILVLFLILDKKLSTPHHWL